MKKIKLTQSKYALIDDNDFNRISQYKWHAHRNNNKYYAKRTMWNIDLQKAVTVYMHREIIECNNYIIDHIDGDGLNNVRSNLRKCTSKENLRNRKSHKNSSSQYKGVSWNIQAGKWKAYIAVNKTLKHLGYFKTEVEAAKVHNNAATLYHGDYANLNKI